MAGSMRHPWNTPWPLLHWVNFTSKPWTPGPTLEPLCHVILYNWDVNGHLFWSTIYKLLEGKDHVLFSVYSSYTVPQWTQWILSKWPQQKNKQVLPKNWLNFWDIMFLVEWIFNNWYKVTKYESEHNFVYKN